MTRTDLLPEKKKARVNLPPLRDGIHLAKREAAFKA
jgi:hypothetical protein